MDTLKQTAVTALLNLPVPQMDHQQLARAQLQNLQQQCQIGDVISPLAEVWEVQT